MQHTEKLITVAKIGTSYGIKGWLKIHTFTEFGTSILNYRPWYVSTFQHTWQLLDVEDAKMHHRTIIAKFKNINNPEVARLETGKLIAVQRSSLPALKKGEYYWFDLEGLQVINQDGKVLGRVNRMLATGSNDVLIIKGEKEIAVPFLVPSVITKVDLVTGNIYVNWDPI